MSNVIFLQEDLLNPGENSQKKRSYVVKIINPNGMGGYELHPLVSRNSFDRVQDIKECIHTSCQEYVESDKQLRFGYIVPGHGKKGKQVEIILDDDLREMYMRYKRGTEIVLWMKQTASRKRSRTPESGETDSRKRSRTPTERECSTSTGRKPGRSNYDKHIEKMSAVDKICDELSDKHGEKYTPEQYRCWANLIQLHKHESYESPPDKRFFTVKSKGAVATTSSGVSPSKRINMRSECMSQLDKWHALKERGIITEEQYKEVQDKIMSDIQKV